MGSRGLIGIVAVGLVLGAPSAAVSVPAAADATASRFSLRGIVTRAVDGDTLVARLIDGRRARVQLIGVKTPELRPPQCYGSEAANQLRQLALGKRVQLRGDPTQPTYDRQRQLLAYVLLPGRVDLGRSLLAAGFVTVRASSRPFLRLAAYQAAQDGARQAGSGRWGACVKHAPIGDNVVLTPTLPPPPPPPVVPIGSDLAPTPLVINFRPAVSGETGAGVVTSSPEAVKCSSTCTASVPHGISHVTLVANPSSGSLFKGWDGACTGAETSCSLQLTGAPATVGVLFEKVPTPPPPPTPHCYDSADNDSDGKVDYPADPGCSSTTDTSELDAGCHPSYPDFCIPPPPPDLDCGDVAPRTDFTVRRDVPDPDPHGLDGNANGRGCE